MARQAGLSVEPAAGDGRRGMFATTDLIPPLAAARDPAVVEPGLPAGGRTPGAVEPEDSDGAAGHPRLLDGRTDRAGRRGQPAARRRKPPAAMRPGSATCGPSGPASPPWTADRDRRAIHGAHRPGRRRRRPRRRELEPALDRAVVADVVEAWLEAGPNDAGSPRPCWTGQVCSPTADPPRPAVVGDLLIALRQAGAAGVSPPVCAECGKQLAHASSAAARTGTAVAAAPAASRAPRAGTTDRWLPATARTTALRALPARGRP